MLLEDRSVEGRWKRLLSRAGHHSEQKARFGLEILSVGLAGNGLGGRGSWGFAGAVERPTGLRP